MAPSLDSVQPHQVQAASAAWTAGGGAVPAATAWSALPAAHALEGLSGARGGRPGDSAPARLRNWPLPAWPGPLVVLLREALWVPPARRLWSGAGQQPLGLGGGPGGALQQLLLALTVKKPLLGWPSACLPAKTPPPPGKRPPAQDALCWLHLALPQLMLTRGSGLHHLIRGGLRIGGECPTWGPKRRGGLATPGPAWHPPAAEAAKRRRPPVPAPFALRPLGAPSSPAGNRPGSPFHAPGQDRDLFSWPSAHFRKSVKGPRQSVGMCSHRWAPTW